MWFKKLLSQFAYVYKLKRAVGAGFALADMVGIRSCKDCEDVYKQALRFMEEYREFESLAYRKDEWAVYKCEMCGHDWDPKKDPKME